MYHFQGKLDEGGKVTTCREGKWSCKGRNMVMQRWKNGKTKGWEYYLVGKWPVFIQSSFPTAATEVHNTRSTLPGVSTKHSLINYSRSKIHEHNNKFPSHMSIHHFCPASGNCLAHGFHPESDLRTPVFEVVHPTHPNNTFLGQMDRQMGTIILWRARPALP